MITENINEARLHEFVGRAVGDVGATISARLVVIGERLGLYKAMARAGAITSAELALATGTSERYVREWLANQAAGGYVEYDPDTGRYELPAEHAMALAEESSPVYLPGAFRLAVATLKDEPEIREAFKTGRGIGWHEHNPGVYEGVAEFFRPSYEAHVTTSWIPALDGVEEKLRVGARVADVGCGHGTSTFIMARAFPESTFTGFDYHEPSVQWARRVAAETDLGSHVTFDVASAKDYPGSGYDLVTTFDCLHDMGDPVGAARHILNTLAPQGTWMIVEPHAADRLEENLNPVARAYYGFSTFLCTPSSLAQEVGLALGAQAGEARIRKVVADAGFTRFRRAAETPFQMVYEARP
jgi:2-polyprenyl-3-methyl-5-hydroxy-6-metoxy-1,4-benzoquinol methylase